MRVFQHPSSTPVSLLNYSHPKLGMGEFSWFRLYSELGALLHDKHAYYLLNPIISKCELVNCPILRVILPCVTYEVIYCYHTHTISLCFM